MGRKRHKGKRYEALSVGGEDDDDIDIECPLIKYYLK